MKTPRLPDQTITELGRDRRPQCGPGITLRCSLLGILLFNTVFAASANWTFLYREAGIEVYSDGARPPSYRAQGNLDVDVVDILAVFSDIPRRTEWVRNLEESRAIFDNHEDRVLVYSRYHLPWPACARDSIIESKFTKDYKSGELTVRFNSIEAAGEPPKNGIVRVPRADGVLYLKVLAEGKTFVRYEVTLDPGGWLPQWICNFFTRDAPIDMLKSMRRRIVEKRALYREFAEAQKRLWHANHVSSSEISK